MNPNKLRQHVLDMVFSKQSGHIGGSFSIAELVAYLYSNFDLISEDGDKLILSKGHAVPIIYAALFELNLLDSYDLNTFREVNSNLQGHPDKLRMKYLHATTGSLGQGLSIAIGHAIAIKMKQLTKEVFCILGDGEMQEGQIWEALMMAPRFRLPLNNLTCFVDCNGAQNDDYVANVLDLGDLYNKIEVFGWHVISIDGHNMHEIKDAIDVESELPKCIIMKTVKGKGVSFMEGSEWHSKAPNQKEYDIAKDELCKLLEMDLATN